MILSVIGHRDLRVATEARVRGVDVTEELRVADTAAALGPGVVGAVALGARVLLERVEADYEPGDTVVVIEGVGVETARTVRSRRRRASTAKPGVLNRHVRNRTVRINRASLRDTATVCLETDVCDIVLVELHAAKCDLIAAEDRKAVGVEGTAVRSVSGSAPDVMRGRVLNHQAGVVGVRLAGCPAGDAGAACAGTAGAEVGVLDREVVCTESINPGTIEVIERDVIRVVPKVHMDTVCERGVVAAALHMLYCQEVRAVAAVGAERKVTGELDISSRRFCFNCTNRSS